ncbi:hypothetical protein ACLOJK_036929 [Asimina triloba]
MTVAILYNRVHTTTSLPQNGQPARRIGGAWTMASGLDNGKRPVREEAWREEERAIVHVEWGYCLGFCGLGLDYRGSEKMTAASNSCEPEIGRIGLKLAFMVSENNARTEVGRWSSNFALIDFDFWDVVVDGRSGRKKTL